MSALYVVVCWLCDDDKDTRVSKELLINLYVIPWFILETTSTKQLSLSDPMYALMNGKPAKIANYMVNYTVWWLKECTQEHCHGWWGTSMIEVHGTVSSRQRKRRIARSTRRHSEVAPSERQFNDGFVNEQLPFPLVWEVLVQVNADYDSRVITTDLQLKNTWEVLMKKKDVRSTYIRMRRTYT